ncbi:MAG: hypothetical protein ABS76_20245 [Pelagibacterium sp. SCN 64-44]|nr:MAG: hypothetical protein ABS76_20245 [Pelagibacterium sp. SCN 64-44]
MASHLTIISGSSGGVNGRTFQQQAGESNGVLGLFSALLGAKPAETAPAAANGGTRDADKDVDLAALFQLGLDAASAEDGEGEAADAEAIAALLALKTADAAPADPTPLVDFIDALAALKASLDRGEPLDPDLLTKVDDALAGLAEALGLTLDDLPVPEDFAALLGDAGGNGLAGMLNTLLAPLAQSLAGAQPGADAAALSGEAAAREQLKALGDKLAALLAALEDGAVDAEKLAAIGMKPGAPPAEDIEAALSRFAATLAAEADIPEEPALAAPALKTTEPVLSGKPAEPAPQAANTADAVKLDGKGQERDERASARDSEAPRRDSRPTAPANAPVSAETANNAAPAAQPAQAAQDNSVLRLEATNVRVVQAGYQTSQQQLNLPQLAFELARQVQDGNTRFQIRLDPPELGRIDVRLDIDKAGQVHARLAVEKSETLDLMQRDQRALERALQQAGLDSGKTSLEFTLKQNPFAGQQDRSEHGGDLVFGGEAVEAEAEPAPPLVNLYRGSLQASGVNIIA